MPVRLLLAILLGGASFAPAASAPPVEAAAQAAAPAIPLDTRGLPLWEIRQWDDVPVRLALPDRAALEALLARVPLRDFDRERLRPLAGGGLELRLRVTDAEAEALREAGYEPEAMPDLERQARQEMERAWAEQVEAARAARDEAGAAAAGAAAALEVGDLGVYHTHAQVGAFLAQIAADHPAIAAAGSLGPSVLGRDIWSLRISDQIGSDEAEPEVRLAATIHGDEPLAMELLLYLAEHLTSLYGDPAHPEVTALVDGYDITLVPCLNPDGLVAVRRSNSHGIDLNRNYPVPDGTVGYDNTWTEEQETLLLKAHGAAGHFVVSSVGHGGALLVNYPWDYTYTATPDEPAIVQLSLAYSSLNLPMYNGDFPQGISNGADWYVVKGSLQDWSYHETGCVDLTIEQSDIKTPPASQLENYWLDNRDSYLALIRAARYGVNGRVTAAGSGLPLAATVTVTGNAKPVTTDPDHGDYYKLLPTGTWELTFAAEGYQAVTVPGVATVWGTPTVLDVQLAALPTGEVAGTVRDGRGLRLDAFIEALSLPERVPVARDTAWSAEGGAYALTLPHGSYELTVTSPAHLPAVREIVVDGPERSEDFVLQIAEQLVLLDCDFEDGPDGWTGAWGREGPGLGHASDWALADSPGAGVLYPSSADLVATTAGFDLRGVVTAEVVFWARWDIETDWDACRLEASSDGGGTWQALPTLRTVPGSGQGAQLPAGAPLYEGVQAAWVEDRADLADWIGLADVRLRWRLGSDGSIERDGFHLDDLQLRAVRPTLTGAQPPLAVAAPGLRARPNPFNPRTTIAFTLDRPGPVRLAVHDVRGRLVRVLLATDLTAGSHAAIWDGTTAAGRPAASGAYFARLEAGGRPSSLGLLLLK